MRGVINLRGGVVPVIDMRLKFGMTMTEKTVNTCVIITEVMLEEESVIIGALSDSVKEVFDLEPTDIEPAPRIGTQIRTDFLKGMGKKDGEFILILDVDKVFSTEELAMVQSIGGMEEEVKEEPEEEEEEE
jgi:purine-binding chemotaxis protein CheW